MFNSDISIIQLNPYYKKQVSFLLKSYVHISPKWFDFLHNKLDHYLQSSSIFPALFGAFKKEELIYIFGMEKWEGVPYASLTYRKKKKMASVYNPIAQGEVAYTTQMVKYGEKHGIVSFYYFTKQTPYYFNFINKLAKNNKDEYLSKYFSYTEAIIPKNTKPKEYAYWEIMGFETKPWTGEIRRVMLKPKFLKSVLHS